MNEEQWQEIKEKYNKAYYLYIGKGYDDIDYCFCDILRFFDSYGIIININYHFYKNEYQPVIIINRYNQIKGDHLQCVSSRSSREEAQNAATTKVFSILNEMLENKNKPIATESEMYNNIDEQIKNIKLKY